ncbi:MAG: hypothetical protein ACI861_000476 [Paracoccaceae bacterium]|jgi:hypothetical protein
MTKRATSTVLGILTGATMQASTIRNGFWLAGLANIFGVLLFSKGFSSGALSAYDPVVMSDFGLVMIIVWGLAYISIAKNALRNRWIVGVFAIEKLIYVAVWLLWVTSNFGDLAAIYADDFLAGIFFSFYGLSDLVFAGFFLAVFRKAT